MEGGNFLKKSIANKLKHLSTHAKQKVKYDHQHNEIGYNYRMINLAAVGYTIEKIQKILAAKRKILKHT